MEVDEQKDDPLDFVLWKAAKPGEPLWDSPWGPGRPGWHIECSAMSMDCLGNHFDIHGGGMDLKFPHHENEIAQSEAATGEQFVNTWIHVGFVRVNEEKMSKSLGNFFTVREILKSYNAEVVRYFILASHYRSPLDYSDESLDQAKSALARLYTALKDQPLVSVDAAESKYEQAFFGAMDDDFNTAVAVSVLFDLAHEINRLKTTDVSGAATLAVRLRRLGDILGLLHRDPDEYLKGKPRVYERRLTDTVSVTDTAKIQYEMSEQRIEELICERTAARQAKNWSESDRIRDELMAKGVILEDGAGGTTWRRA